MTGSIQYTKDRNPWYSFRPYQESDANSFKGRGKDITEVMKFIVRNNVVVCYAKSGIGKSSLINAGLMPRLRKKQILPIQIKFTENFFATENLEEIIRNLIYSEIQKLNKNAEKDNNNERYSIEKHPSIEENALMTAIDKELADTSIWWWLNTYQIICKHGEFDIVYQPILIFDQFEELFQNTQTDEQRKKFFNWLQEMSLARPSNIIQKQIQNIQKEYPDINVYLPQDCGWKILLSLREDYVGLLDYWCIQRIKIPAIQDNRYCLMPLTTEQAEEVITQQTIDGQRVNTLDKYKQAIIDSLIDTDGIPAVLLSVLCNRIYDEVVSGGNTYTAQKLLHMASDAEIPDKTIKTTISYLIRSVYEERIKESKISNRIVQKIEQLLVRDNGTRRRLEMNEMSKSLQIACRKLANTYLVRIENFGERKGMRVQYVEIIHDRVAEIIANKRHKIAKKKKVLWSRLALVAGIISLFVYTYWNQLSTYNEKKAQHYRYMELKDKKDKANASDYYGICKELWALQTLICDTDVVISNCPILETIDASNYDKSSSLSIKVSDCEKLMYINLNKNINTLSLDISGCPLIQQIELPENISGLDLKITSNKITFKISNKNPYFIWSNGILWDKKNDSILYARSDVPENIIVPFGTDKNKYSYAPHIYSVENPRYLKLDYYEDGIKNSINIDRNTETLDLSTYPIREIPDGLFKNIKELKAIKFPSSSYINIGKEAFLGCDNLTTIEFDDSSHVHIQDYAFANCSNLVKIKFPQEIAIDSFAFKNCSSIKELIFKEKASISDDSFNGCISLKKVRLPNHIRWFSPNSFIGCLNIKFEYDNLYWDTADDGTIFLQKNHEILLTNMVKYHTFENSIFYSKNGILYKGDYKFNEPMIDNIQQNTKFISNGRIFINNIENPATIYFSPDNISANYELCQLRIVPTNLKELHLPFSNAIDLSSIDNSIPDSIKANVTLYVPYGCLKYFINHPSYKEFKNIKEEKLYNSLAFIIKYHFETGLNVVSSFNLWIMIAIIVISAALILAWFMYYKKRKEENVVTNKDKCLFVLKAFATATIGPCFWYIFYWFFYLTILPLFNNKGIIYSPLTWGSLAILSSVISIISVYIILYSDGFNLNGLWNSTKNNLRVIKQISVNAREDPKKTIKILLLILLPFIIHSTFVQYKEYNKNKLLKAINYINREMDKATNHPDSALSIYYEVWENTRDIINNKDIEQTLYNAVYSKLIEKGLADTCLQNVNTSFVTIIHKGELLFNDQNRKKTYLLKANNDTVPLIKDCFDFYKINTSEKYIAFSKTSSKFMIMNLLTQKIDTINNYEQFNFIPQKPLLAYSKNKSILFYDLNMKKGSAIRPIYMNHEIKDFCCNENGDVVTISSDNKDDNIILLYHRRMNKWEEPDTISKFPNCLSPIFITKNDLFIQHDNSLIVWQCNNIGKNERRWKIYNNLSENSFSPDRKLAITFWSNKLKILDLSSSEKTYATINMPRSLNAACFSKDGKSIYVGCNNLIIRIPLLSVEQVYKKLKEKVGNH